MRTLRVLALLTSTLCAAVFVWAALTLPPRPLALPPPSFAAPRGLVRGVLHVHSTRSDGTGSVDEIAGAAARAGLNFVILTDHGDGTRVPDPPAYHAGVLCIDAVEVSTSGGHYAAVGMTPSPYPLGGEARDVVEDVRRLGGFGIVAHPNSPKPDLRWTEWDAPFDAIEWLNTDSEWRDASSLGMVRLLLSYPLRGAAAIASAFRRPDALLARWDDLTRTRPVVALAGADAHARFGFQGRRDPYLGFSLPGFPSYETSFRVFAIRAVPSRPFSGSAAEDAALLLAALSAGRAYTAIDAIAGPAVFEFTATSGAAQASAGGRLDAAGPVTLLVRVNAPPGATIVLRANGQVAAQAAGAVLSHISPPTPAVYRVEITAPGAPRVPWLVSNPIYVGAATEPPPVAAPGPAERALPLLDPGRLTAWHIENERRSEASVARAAPPDDQECVMTFQLGPGEPAGQFVALARPLEPGALLQFDRISFRARAAAPMRLSVQVRGPGGRDGQRWQRSVYLDRSTRDVTIFFNDMRPIGPTDSRLADRRLVDGLLFVVDTTNARGGTSGRVWVSDVRLEK